MCAVLGVCTKMCACARTNVCARVRVPMLSCRTNRDSQTEHILLTSMHITNLCNSAIDNTGYTHDSRVSALWSWWRLLSRAIACMLKETNLPGMPTHVHACLCTPFSLYPPLLSNRWRLVANPLPGRASFFAS